MASTNDINVYELLFLVVQKYRDLETAVVTELNCQKIKNIEKYTKQIVNSPFIKTVDNIWQGSQDLLGLKKSKYWSYRAIQLYKTLYNTVPQDKRALNNCGENFVRDHVVPKKVHAVKLLEMSKRSDFTVAKLKEYLDKNYLISIITKVEDGYFVANPARIAYPHSLKNSMPELENWDWAKGPLSRYHAVGITISKGHYSSFL